MNHSLAELLWFSIAYHILFIISKLLDKFLLGPKSFVSDFVEALEKKKEDLFKFQFIKIKNHINTK
jgi:hypothetical protein